MPFSMYNCNYKKIITTFIVMLLAFSLLCGCGLNFVREGNNTQQTDEPTVSPEETPDNGSEAIPTPEPAAEATDSPVSDGIINVNIGGESVEVAAYKAAAELREAPSLSFEIYIEGENYKGFDNTVHRYAYSGDESGNTYIEISIKNRVSAEDLAPSFLNDYLDFKSIEFSSYTKIGKDGLSAYKINASNNEQYAEAYLIDSSGDVVAVVISCSTEYSSECLPYLSAMLDTFALID